MKNILVRSLAFVALFSLFSVSCFADAAAHAQIIKERDTVLSAILAYHESRIASGLADAEAIVSAQIALYAFRRDTAATVAEKIKQQELIVQAQEKRLAWMKTKMSTGVATQLDLLTATDVLLQAKQIVEELRLSEKKN